MSNFTKFTIVVVLIIFTDLLTKELSEIFLENRNIIVIPNFFDLTLVWNKGAAFGILAQAPEWIRKLVLIGASTIAAIATIAYAYFKQLQLSKIELYSLALIAGGAIGNLYDRAFLGKVRDFIDWHIFQYHWPAFNIADASITIGIIGFIFNELYLKKKNTK